MGKIMETEFVCPDCGLKLENNLADCPMCGCPKDDLKLIDHSAVKSLESSNDFSAEIFVNTLANINLFVGVLVGIAGLIAGIVVLSEGRYGAEPIGISLIVVGLIFLLFSLVFWALLKLLVNISYRLTKLDNKQK